MSGGLDGNRVVRLGARALADTVQDETRADVDAGLAATGSIG
jgi:hypothetical protein